MIIYVGLDDTGKPGHTGTGELALALGRRLQSLGLARLLHISMHQLLAPCEDLPGCSLNQAYCLTLEGDPARLREIELESRVYVNRNFAADSRPGLALAHKNQVAERVLTFSKACRMMPMLRSDAQELSRENGITLTAFSGDGRGTIGALAAIGWRRQGSDGAITWMPGLTDLKGVMTLTGILELCTFDLVKTVRGKTPFFGDRIQLGKGVTPLLKSDCTLLLLEAGTCNANWEWTAIGPEHTGQINW